MEPMKAILESDDSINSDSGSLLLEGVKLRARLIREGLSQNRNRWTKTVLEQLAKLSEGAPINLYDMSQNGDASMLAHWEALRERLPPAIRMLLPEVLPGATIATVKNPRVVVEADGVAAVIADVEPHATAAGWLPELVTKMRGLGRTLGLSIHVPPDGMTSKPIENGGREPLSVSRVVGFDVVSFPSAGGGFVPVLESLAHMEEVQMDKLKWLRLLRWAKKADQEALKAKIKVEEIEAKTLLEQHRAVVEELFKSAGLKFDANTAVSMLESLHAIEPPAADPPAPPAPPATPAAPAAGALEGADVAAQLKAVQDGLAALNRANTIALIEARVTPAELPAGLKAFAKTQMLAMLEGGQTLDVARIDGFIAELKKSVGSSQDGHGGRGSDSVLEGANPLAIQFGITSADRALAALEGLLLREREVTLSDKSKLAAFHSIKQAYQVCTGDYGMQGREFYATSSGRRLRGALESVDVEKEPILRELMMLRGASTLEAITTGTFTALLSDRMHKVMLTRYKQYPMQWQLFARAETVTDFKTWRFLKSGEFNDIASVNENAAYVVYADASYPAEEEVTLAVVKRGQLMTLTWEMIVNDDTGVFQSFPEKVARAAVRTLNKNVINKVMSNAVIYTTTALGTAGQSNLKASAISLANLKAMRRDMVTRQDIDAQEGGRFVPRRVVLGPQIYDVGYELIMSPNKPLLAGTDTNPALGTPATSTIDNNMNLNVLRGDYGLSLHEVILIDSIDADAYAMLADPVESEMMVVGFLNGKQEPELFLQDLATVGSFFDKDVLTWKVRHVYESVVVDYRGFQLGIP